MTALSIHRPQHAAAPRPAAATPQLGQALMEGMVALMALLSLWVGLSWLARLQDMALQAAHASRYAAFAFTRNPQADTEGDVRRHYFSGPAHQWSDRRGQRLLGDGLAEVALRYDSGAALAAQAQAGGAAPYAQSLRQGWRIEDTGILAGHVAVAPWPGLPPGPAASPSAGLNYFDSQRLVLRRHTAILAGAGHAPDDAAAQQLLAGSALAWGKSADASYALGAQVAAAMVRVDAAWNRSAPVFDWLAPWAGRVPDPHLHSEIETEAP
ncbi:hypothetical protein [Pollutimonas bauzanensis]|uniref:TadE-like protein n=1 Tax=Pollutimonas bauzanensis TaxID=658167 RepID=A0A1M5M9B6_9BURK|nr:hypothetical protein [Pollutimonas bauzanensis]SHG73860.1 hypothetical protein SAMN04488135_101164 [Pollutimonas bauzanensis]